MSIDMIPFIGHRGGRNLECRAESIMAKEPTTSFSMLARLGRAAMRRTWLLFLLLDLVLLSSGWCHVRREVSRAAIIDWQRRECVEHIEDIGGARRTFFRCSNGALLYPRDGRNPQAGALPAGPDGRPNGDGASSPNFLPPSP